MKMTVWFSSWEKEEWRKVQWKTWEYLKGQVCGFGVSLYSHAHYMLYMLNSKSFKVENERNKRKIVVLLLRKRAMLR